MVRVYIYTLKEKERPQIVDFALFFTVIYPSVSVTIILYRPQISVVKIKCSENIYLISARLYIWSSSIFLHVYLFNEVFYRDEC